MENHADNSWWSSVEWVLGGIGLPWFNQALTFENATWSRDVTPKNADRPVRAFHAQRG